MKTICVYCGSSPGLLPDYRESARRLGFELAARGLRLVYGGASVGVMGAVADAVLEQGGKVTGVIPRSLATREVSHAGLDELFVVGPLFAPRRRPRRVVSERVIDRNDVVQRIDVWP